MSIKSKAFLKINDKRYDLISTIILMPCNYDKIVSLLFGKFNIKSIESFNRFLKENKIEILVTSSKKITETSQNGTKTNIELTNQIYENNHLLHKNLFEKVSEYLKEFLLKYYQDLRLKEEQERKDLEAKKIKLEQDKIEKERVKKEKEETENTRLLRIGRLCDKLFDIESFDQNYEEKYSGSATLKIKPYIEGKSIIQHRIIGRGEPPYHESKIDRVRLQDCISERNSIEFRW